jgi:hypothetical protein
MYKISGDITVELTTTIREIISAGVLHTICEHRGIPLPTDENVVATEDAGSDDSGASVCTGSGQDVAESEAVMD